MSDKEKVQQILTKYTISELVEYHIEAVDRINKAIEYIKEWQHFPHTNDSTHKELENLMNILRGNNENE